MRIYWTVFDKFGNKADNGTTKCHVFHDITIYIRLGRTSEL